MPVLIPKLDDKSFEALVDEAKLLIPRYAPTWTDHNFHDPGITLIELFAWLAESEIYTLDQITDQHLAKFLKLLGFPQKPAYPATATVVFRLPQGKTEPVVIPRGTRLIGRRLGTGIDILFETQEDLNVVAPQLQNITRINAQGEMSLTDAYNRGPYIYPFGGESGEPIASDSRFILGFDHPFPTTAITFTLSLYEDDLPRPGAHGDEEPNIIPSAEVQWEYWAKWGKWLPLQDLKDDTLSLTRTGFVRFKGPEDMMSVPKGSESFYQISCRITESGHEIPPRIAAIDFNTVTVIEGKTVPRHTIGSGSGLPSQQIELGEAPIVSDSLALDIQEVAGGEWIRWNPVSNFDASMPADRHFRIDLTKGTLLFGNGLHGRIAPKGTNNIQACYQVGGGEQGNLASGEINRVPDFPSVFVTHSEPATGGKDPEPIEAVWRRVKADLVTPYRAVTSYDYEAIAKATPGLRVARARAIQGFDPEQPNAEADCLVTVVVVPYSFTHCPIPSEGFLKTVCHHLDRHRLITTQLRVIPPMYVEVSVETEVIVKAKSDPDEVKKRIEQSLAEFLDPLRGGSEKTGWPFGRYVYRSELASRIEQVEGVECIVRLRLDAKHGTVLSNGDIQLLPTALVCTGSFTIEAKRPSPVCEVKCPKPAH